MMAQVNQARESALADAYGWVFEIKDLTTWVTLKHRQHPENIYLLRVTFDEFPRRAPSCVFVDQETKELGDKGWPANVKHPNPPPGICTPGTREFHENIHHQDAQWVWDSEKYPFIATLQMIHQMMERGVDQ